MKKKIALLLAFAMLFAVVGCSTNSGIDDPVNVITATNAPEPTGSPNSSDSVNPTGTPEPTDIPTPTAIPDPTDEPEPTNGPEPTESIAPPATDIPEPAPDIDTVLKTYEYYLDELVNNSGDGYHFIHFSLDFIDEDDIPELLVSFSGSMGEPVYVYTFVNSDEVAQCGCLGSNGSFSYRRKSNLIVSDIGLSSYRTTDYYKIGSNKEFELICEVMAEYIDDETANYYIDGAPADQETYYAKMDSFDSFSEDSYSFFFYGYSQPYADYNENDKPAILRSMYEAALDDRTYSSNAPDSYRDLYGEWELTEYFTLRASDVTGNTDCYSAEDANVRLFISDIGIYLRAQELIDDSFDFEFTELWPTYFSPSPVDNMINTDYCYKATALDGAYVYPIYISDYIDGDGTHYIELLLDSNIDGDKIDYHFFFTKSAE